MRHDWVCRAIVISDSRADVDHVRNRLGIAYAGTAREDISELLLPSVADSAVTMEIASLAALALGFVFVGSGNGDIAGTILQVMMERQDKELDEKWTRFMALGLALLFLGSCPSGMCHHVSY